MADHSHATNPSTVNATCAFCNGALPSLRKNFCSSACSNRARTDHSDETLMVRFWKKVDKTPGFGPAGDCWRWTARLDGRGYGELKVAGIYRKAHRIALFGRQNLSDPHFACHRCDNPQCVNPAHLFPGEPVDNVRDMIAKGRKPQVGRKLTDSQVREARCSKTPAKALARSFGVTDMVIKAIRSGRTYKDIA